MNIGILDSGKGAITVLKEVIKLLPNNHYIYYADGLNSPYGNKTKEELFKIVCNVVEYLIKRNCQIIICACNTATTMVLKELREKYPNIIFIGTEPAVKVLYDKYKDKKSIVLVTEGTNQSKKFKELLKEYQPSLCKILVLKDLANLIENNKDTKEYLNRSLKGYKDIEVVALGCTHFPLVKEEIKNILGNVIFVEGSREIANHLKNYIKKETDFKLEIFSSNQKEKELTEFLIDYFSKDPDFPSLIIKKILL